MIDVIAASFFQTTIRHACRYKREAAAATLVVGLQAHECTRGMLAECYLGKKYRSPTLRGLRQGPEVTTPLHTVELGKGRSVQYWPWGVVVLQGFVGEQLRARIFEVSSAMLYSTPSQCMVSCIVGRCRSASAGASTTPSGTTMEPTPIRSVSSCA